MALLTSQDAFEALIEQLQEIFRLVVLGRENVNNIYVATSLVLSDFAVNSSELTVEHTTTLDQLSDLLLELTINNDNNTAITLTIEIDELVGRASQTGEEAYNMALGQSRAEAVRTYLTNGLTYLPTLISKGSEDPLVDSSQNEVAINRSVEIKMLVSIDTTPLEETLDHWQDVAHHDVPTDIKSMLDGRDFTIQTLDNADPNSDTNLDFYQVKITEMPEKAPGILYTLPELFNEIRLNLSDLIAFGNNSDNPNTPALFRWPATRYLVPMLAIRLGGSTSFKAYSTEDEIKWQSANPLGAVMQFDTLAEDMGVVCSDYQQDHWIFTTIADGAFSGDVGSHPVSGHRKFGYFEDASGDKIIYTKGMDRTAYLLGTDTQVPLLEPAVDWAIFTGGHFIWLALQAGIVEFIEERGGAAEILRPLSNRKDHQQIQAHFYGQ